MDRISVPTEMVVPEVDWDLIADDVRAGLVVVD